MLETHKKTFQGTNEAFTDLLSSRAWYKGLLLKGKSITKDNASQIRRRFEGKTHKGLSIEAQEELLQSAGYKVLTPVIWQKEQ